MGNYISPCNCAAKIVLPDGTVQALDEPAAVAELMLEHPHNIVVEYFRSSTSTTKLLRPLPADYTLDPGRVYVMVPMARGKANGVSVEEARRIVSAAESRMIRPTTKIALFGMCVLGASEEGEEVIMVGDRNGACRYEEVKEVEEVEEVDAALGEFEKPELICRQYSSKGWKPSLGTIVERTFDQKKMPHWLF